jgi:hypothetical protein
VSEALRSSDPAENFVLVTNQVTSWLAVRKLLKSPEFSNRRERLYLIPVTNASESELVIQKLRPQRAMYLKHHPLNHMLLRLNGLVHTLWKPDLDPYFAPDHSLVTYDDIYLPESKTEQFLHMLPSLSRPELSKS